jgi:ABC-type uncharacterized transport system substrate-binding protein
VCRQFITLLLSGAIALLPTCSQAETFVVRLVLSDSTAPYQQFSTALNKALSATSTANKATLPILELHTGGDKKTNLAIAVGIKATEIALADFDVPVLSVMVPKAGYEALLEKHLLRKKSKTISAIYLDQPWNRQMSFIQAALPKHGIIGILYSPNTHIVLPRLPQGMSLNAKSVRSGETLFAALENILESSDVLLVTPDSEIYSSSNLRNILLTSYRKKVPLIGISQAYVNAGALCAIFSTPEQIAWQAAEAIISFAQNRQLPEPQYPASFSIGINQQVANSLEIEIAPPEIIRQSMEKAGEGAR